MTPRIKNHVFIGIAIGSGQEGVTRFETSTSILNLLASGNNEFEFFLSPGGGCDVAHARNLMTHEARTKTSCAIYGNMDSDLKFSAAQVLRILRWFENPDIHVIAGMYPLKDRTLRWSYNLWAEESKKFPGLWEVGEVCTGCLFYRASVIDEMIAAYPESEYVIEDNRFKGQTGYELFAMGPVAPRDWLRNGKPYRRRMSEDFMFSMRLRDMGHTIYVDPSVKMGHIGTIDYLELHTKGVGYLRPEMRPTAPPPA